MSKRMLVDGTHPEEVRVVVLDGNRLEEYDVETSTKRQLKGNIYLAKVTRVEPSLQAAFIEYGGNRHGFLAFNEIHPDYFQIPIEDRQALLEEEEAYNRDSGDLDDLDEIEGGVTDTDDDDFDGDDAGASDSDSDDDEFDASAEDDASSDGDVDEADAPEAGEGDDDETAASVDAAASEADEADEQEADDQPENDAGADEDADAEARAVSDGDADSDSAEDDEKPSAIAEATGTDTDAVIGSEATDADASSDADEEAEPEAEAEADADSAAETESRGGRRGRGRRRGRGGDNARRNRNRSGRGGRSYKRRYRIQEVIKRGQILLVQVVKEERGNKGAALTTYISLAGRYCVLMPNTSRGGGVSRKITSPQARRKLRDMLDAMEIPDGMGLIMRTAGVERSKAEVKRDADYLLRTWDEIRELTLQSTAPALVYEEANLVKRAIRDLYGKEMDEVLIAGNETYQTAKKFMRLMMPSHAKKVQPYRDGVIPLFHRFQVESQLDAMHSPTVQLKSGGYIVMHSTEALVAIDVNSGRSTRERNIEETAVATNLEAATEVARQLRLRDLSGLIVIDFIDMEEGRHLRQVERRLKEAMKSDRARIQIGRISAFGLMELSRQRLRPSLIEASTAVCPHCEGTGFIRSTESLAVRVLRAIEEEGVRQRSSEVTVSVPTQVALYILNQKRSNLIEIEERYGFRVEIAGDGGMISADMKLERRRIRQDAGDDNDAASGAIIIEDSITANDAEVAAAADTSDETSEGGGRRRRRRRSRRRGRGEGERDEATAEASEQDQDSSENAAGNDGDNEEEAQVAEATEGDSSTEDGDEERPRRRRRGRRGGRRRSRRSGEGEAAENAAPEAPAFEGQDLADAPQPEVALTPANVASEIFGGPIIDTTPVDDAEPATRKEDAGAAAEEPAQAEAEEEAPEEEAALQASDSNGAAQDGTDEAVDEEPVAVSEPEDTPVQTVVVGNGSEQDSGGGSSDGPKKRGWWQRLVD